MKLYKDNKLIIQIGVVALIIFICNCITHICVDDYSYSLNMFTGQRIAGYADILENLIDHAYNINGRLAPHLWVYLFLYWPKWIFNIVNTGMFALFVYMCCRIAGVSTRRFYAVAAGLIWLTMPAFGQVILWLDGSCNYLWGCTFTLIFISPAVQYYTGDGSSVSRTGDGSSVSPKHYSLWQMALLYIFAYYVGTYNENMSAMGIFSAAVLFILGFIRRKKEGHAKFTDILQWGAYELCAGLGFITLLLMPATQNNKIQLSWDKWDIFNRGMTTIKMVFTNCWFLILLWIALFILLIIHKQYQKLTWPIIMLVFAVVSNEMFIAAPYYVPRSMIFTDTMLLISCLSMVESVIIEQTANNHTIIIRIEAILASVILIASLIFGMSDIGSVYMQELTREKMIKQAISLGEDSVTLPQIEYYSEYPATSGLKNLNPEDPTAWQNAYMATYYGIGTILGEEY